MLALADAMFVALTAALGLTVWPQPQKQTSTGATYVLDFTNFSFAASGAGAQSEVLLDAFKRYRSIILLHSATSHPQQSFRQTSGTIASVRVKVASADETLSLETDQSYNLTVGAPTIALEARTVYGALNGLESLSQLVDRGAFINGTRIEDFPRYQFRATMIDTSRHYYPVEVILQHLDAMAYSKFNVLHWHLVDSVSFPYQSKAFPEMAVAGAWSPDHVYTNEDITTVVKYAKNRGIRVVPEFDTPGHVYAGYTALEPPILTTCYDPATGKPLTGIQGTGPLDPTINATYTFLTTLFKELQGLFPDKFVHVGGDEVDPGCWASNPQVQAYMKAHSLTSFADLETLYEQRLLDLLKAQGTSYIVWQEIFDNGARIAKDTVIDVWKGGNWQEEMANVAKAGFHSVLSAPFYLNYISYGEDWPTYYAIEPSNFTGGAAADKAGLVGGVEVCMWSEFVDASNFISRIWPRAAAVGERGWSDKSVRDVDDARHRLHELRCKLLARGINAEPIANGGAPKEGVAAFCPQEWVPKYDRPWVG